MKTLRILLLLLATLPASVVLAHPGQPDAKKKPGKTVPTFVYDPADEMIEGQVLDKSSYDAGLLAHDGALWLAWLEFVPDKGDLLWIGASKEGKWLWKTKLADKPGVYARPSLTRDSQGHVWLSYEAGPDDHWDVFVARCKGQAGCDEPVRVSTGKGVDINHRVAAADDGTLWFVWQTDRDGQFDVAARPVRAGKPGPIDIVSASPRGDWHPTVAATGNNVHVAWDSHDGKSFNVLARQRSDVKWQDIVTVSATPAFEGRAQLAADGAGRVWILWEEGSLKWGQPYRVKGMSAHADGIGPLHRFRRLHLAQLLKDGKVALLEEQTPMLSFEAAHKRRPADSPVRDIGAFYERGRLAVDGSGRLWVFYRHMYFPWLGLENRSHVQSHWGVYGRCLTEAGWSKLLRFTPGQGDGMQRLETVPEGEGIALAFTTGRTDRRAASLARGVVVAHASVEGKPARTPKLAAARSVEPAGIAPISARPGPARVGGKDYHVYFGDLHRHTDLSLCRVPVDGTIDDAYRYAAEAVRHDFLAITDHSRDLAKGDALSQLWWRCRKEVYRHELARTFLPFYGYERSHGDTADHNVISLRGDMLRKHTYPVPKFWKELDPADTITIPHQPYRKLTWSYQDDGLRPLLEIFQGCRNRATVSDAHKGLEKGYKIGFIASSDHMSTAVSFACVWAEEPTRASIFKAMKARRTYGATAPLRLVVKAGGHWMGEAFECEEMPPLEVEVNGTAPLRSIRFVVDGKVGDVVPVEGKTLKLALKHSLELQGKHHVYVHVVQTDGNEAWSSPMWVTVGK